MLGLKAVLYALCASTHFALGLGAFSITSKNNMAVYYGQGYNQQPLNVYCQDPAIDVIILSFVNLFPENANGYPGLDLGNQCSGDTYPGPGYNGVNNASANALHKCPNIQRDLNYCRKISPDKKFILSLGGGTIDYQLTGKTNGIKLATQLFYIFGPQQANLIASGIPRPFDFNGAEFSVDGFDLDIEHPSNDNSAGYIALVKELKRLFGTNKSKTFYLTASPACYYPDDNNESMLSNVAFDMLFIQFYGSLPCSSARWAAENPRYKVGGPVAYAGFTFDQWTSWLSGLPSQNARLFIGLPGAKQDADPGYAIPVSSASNLANAYYCRPNFGGISIWEATGATASVNGGKNYYQNLKAALLTASSNTTRCATDGTATFPISKNARCGVSGSAYFGTVCPSNQCCSQYGYCGTDPAYCQVPSDDGLTLYCQPGYGTCDEDDA
ncbi:chitin recognition protein [Pestalotiopsis sp. NC0098]|nr:chitin recognition protein [Pestalotiopsis sp. NC0098]